MHVEQRRTLAWHETLELHELTAFQSIGLMKLKMGAKKIEEATLREIYMMTIRELEENLSELLRYYPSAPVPGGRDDEDFRRMFPFMRETCLPCRKPSSGITALR